MTIGHVVDEYLPPTQTFIYTLLRFQRRHPPVVLARRTANLADFRLDRPVVVPRLPPAPSTLRGGRLRSPYARAYWALHAGRLAAAARRHGCAALHAHFGGEGYNTLRAREYLGVPLVTTFYGFDLALPRDNARWERRYAGLFADGDRFCVEGGARRLGAPLRARPTPPVLRRLYELYAEDNERLYALLGRRIPAWDAAADRAHTDPLSDS